jgi:hypothetical protein
MKRQKRKRFELGTLVVVHRSSYGYLLELNATENHTKTICTIIGTWAMLKHDREDRVGEKPGDFNGADGYLCLPSDGSQMIRLYYGDFSNGYAQPLF